MKHSHKSGFTLVELLIVIAIIGILAATVLSSLNDAREGAITAKIKSEMDAITKRAEIENNINFSYDSICGSNGVPISDVIDEIITSVNSIASSSLVCNSDTTAFAISVPAEGTAHWCVDSAKNRRTISSPLSAGELECPGS